VSNISRDVLANILATVILALLVFILRIPSLLMMLFGRRRGKLRFFGVVGPNPKQVIYLSTLFVIRFGSCNYTGEPRSFAGPAIPNYELAAIEMLHELWQESTLENLPKLLQPTFRRLSWRLQPVQLEVRSSPARATEVDFGGAIVSVGGQHYNVATKLFLDTLRPYMTISGDGQWVLLPRSDGSTEANLSRGTEFEDFGIVQRLLHPPTDTTVMVVAGIGTTGTIGAVHYLTKNWRELSKTFGREPFAVCLGFQEVQSNPNSFLESVVIHRTPDRQ
jgi:hypothetical protein